MVARKDSKDFNQISITDGLIISDPFLINQGIEWKCELIHVSTEASIVFTLVAASGSWDDAMKVLGGSAILKSLVGTGWLLGCPWMVEGDKA